MLSEIKDQRKISAQVLDMELRNCGRSRQLRYLLEEDNWRLYVLGLSNTTFTALSSFSSCSNPIYSTRAHLYEGGLRSKEDTSTSLPWKPQ